MRLPDLIERAVCITIPQRWPAGFASVREQFAARGVGVSALVNGPRASLPPSGPGVATLAHEDMGEPSATWWGSRGAWFHRQAFRSIVAAALADGVGTLAILEDDCLFTPDADAILARVEPPAGWAMIYLGSMLSFGMAEPAGPYVVRIRGARATHAVIYQRSCFEALLGLPPEGPVDHEIAERLHAGMPCYATWPNAVIQEEGTSTMTGWPSADASFFGR